MPRSPQVPMEARKSAPPAVRQLKIRPLTVERIAQAFPLIQASLPQVTLEAWHDFAAALVAQGAPAATGIILVVGERDTIGGLCSYRVERDLVHGLLLNADHFLAFDLFDRRAVAHALAAGVEALARERHCTAIHTSLIRPRGTAPAGGGLVDVLCTRGHRIETLGMCKPLPP